MLRPRSFYVHLARSAVAASTFRTFLPFVSSLAPNTIGRCSRNHVGTTPMMAPSIASARSLTTHRFLSSSSSEREMKRDALQIIRDAIRAVDPYTAIRSNLVRDGDALILDGGLTRLDLTRDYDEIVLVGFGKASSAMATAVLEQIFSATTNKTIPCRGVVICKDGHAMDHESQTLAEHGVEICEASHPVPDDRSSTAAEKLLQLVSSRASPRTLVLCCISGGGSALFCKPAPPLRLEDLQHVNSVLLASGMGIEEMNVVRKRLEEGKGGRLAAACYPSRVVSLILSDVIGDPLDLIASGPTVPDKSTWEDGLDIVHKYNLQDQLSTSVLEILQKGKDGALDDSPSPDHPVFDTARNILVGNNALAVEAVSKTAKKLGYQPVVLGTEIIGEAKEVAKLYTAMASHLQKSLSKTTSNTEPSDTFTVAQSLPVALIAGGETTVSLTPNSGKGGRNQELALSAAVQLDTLDLRNVVLTSIGTDGGDGPTDAAGAVVDATTVRESRSRALEALANHDAYPYLDSLESEAEETPPLIKTGPSGTNVADICVTLIRGPP